MWAAKLVGYVLKQSSKITSVVIDCLKNIVPSHVHNVWHLDHDKDDGEIEEHTLTHIYNGYEFMWNWTKGIRNTMFLPTHGFYLLQTWNSEHKYMNYHFLSAKVLCDVIQTKTLSTWWAMSDIGICTLIASYFVSYPPNMNRVFAIIINGKDVTKELKPFMSSIAMTKNLTAHALCDMYYSFIAKVDNKKHEEDTVTLVDYDLVHREIKGHTYLFE